MITDKFGQYLFEENDLIDVLMKSSGRTPGPFFINGVDVDSVNELVEYEAFKDYPKCNQTIEEFDKKSQYDWFMPVEYKEMDIAKYVLDLCNNQAELQRCGEELLLYQDRDLFNLLRYLVYLVDTMSANNIIWGVGRGSSVSSFVLYKLKVHRVDSMFYKLSINEFLR